MGTPTQAILPNILDSYTNNISQIDIGSLGFLPSNEEVKGELILVEKRFDASEIMKSYDQSFVEGIKKQLAGELVEKILQNKMIEFTKQEDLNTSEVVYRARVYLTPDDVVRYIRKG